MAEQPGAGFLNVAIDTHLQPIAKVCNRWLRWRDEQLY